MQSYNIPSKAIEGSKWIMGLKLENQAAISSKPKMYVPGPGNYNPEFKFAENAMPSYSMKGRYHDQKKLVVPGPGTYQKNMNDK